MKHNFARSLASLDLIFEFIEGSLDTYRCDESISYCIKLAVEELFTNIVKYNRSSNCDISISIQQRSNKIIVNITDPAGNDFDVTKNRKTDTTRRLGERKVGGLGLFLVKKYVDELEYNYSDGISSITFMKKLEH